ncbi:hypothetical protein LguiA_017914 [Lonicera macranthoides]
MNLKRVVCDNHEHQRNKSFPTVLIDANGTLNVAGLEAFVKKEKMADGGHFHISIIGQQSSGKSTLLNALYGTNFAVMNAMIERYALMRRATTHGIWLAKSPKPGNCTLVMDLEGSDGNKRGEDDTKFENQAAVFAVVISEIVLINISSTNVGCVNAAGMPLLRNVFEAMRRHKLHDSKTTLWFVIRDKPESSGTDVIENCLREDISRVRDSVAMGTQLRNSFDVKITILSHYEHKRQEFNNEVANFWQELRAELTTNGKKHLSSGFSLIVQDIWQKIKEDKDLDIPSRRVTVAKKRCEEIADEILSSFENKDCHQLLHTVQSGQIKDFGKSLNSILDQCLSAYDKKTEYYDEGVKTKKRRELHDTMIKDMSGSTSPCTYNDIAPNLNTYGSQPDSAIGFHYCTATWMIFVETNSLGSHRVDDGKLEVRGELVGKLEVGNELGELGSCEVSSGNTLLRSLAYRTGPRECLG